MVPVRVHAPRAHHVWLVRFDGDRPAGPPEPLARDGDDWVGVVPEGAVYGLVADGDGPRFDPSKVLLEPRATAVWFPPGHDRDLAARPGQGNAGRGPLAVARRPRDRRRAPRRSSRSLVVYEVHVRGYTQRRQHPHAGTFRALADEVPRLAALGVTVLELMPVHQNDPAERSCWGYMPLAFGAVEQRYAASTEPSEELADLVDAAHAHDVEVWLDVVFNHTTEIDRTGPTYSLRGLADAEYYRLDAEGDYIQASGCGNDIDITSPPAQDLVMWSLEELADLGVDGFRFDLAPVLSRDQAFLDALELWATARGVRLIAEPWDAAGSYHFGRAWPGEGWMQWNDRFRDDVRGFLRGEGGLVPALQQRILGSPDHLDTPAHSVNFVACHDGFTLHDLVAYDHKHNEANGEANRDGTDHNRSWNCGWEGEDGAPPEVLALRSRQLRNAWCLLLLAHGVPMWTAGDEFGRTQGGNNNAYNQDNDTFWVDWERRERYTDLERFVAGLLTLRHARPMFARDAFWDDVRWFGVGPKPDLAWDSRSLAWNVGDLYVMVNSWWDALTFDLQVEGPWQRVVDTNLPPPGDILVDGSGPLIDGSYAVAGRSVVVLARPA